MKRRALCFVALVIATSPVRAQAPTGARVSLRTEVYADDDETIVARPRVSATVPANDSLSVSGSYMADVVSSASVDVLTRATQSIKETRHEGTVGVMLARPSNGSLGLTYAIGREPDYLSNGLSLSFGRELDEAGLLYLATRVQLSASRVGTVADPRFSRALYGVATQTSLTRVVRRNLLVRGTLELAHLHGFQSSAYRSVRLGQWSARRSDGTDPDEGAWVFTGVTGSVNEHHPDERFRARFALDAVISLSDVFALAALGAGYVDSWRVASGEGSLELRAEPLPGMLIRLGARGYMQAPAWFHRYRYTDVDETRGFLTDDKELGPLRSLGGTLSGSFPVRSVTLDVRGEIVRYRYPHLDMLPEKRAVSIAVGVTWRRP